MDDENSVDARHGLPVIDPIGDHTKGKRLRLCYGLGRGRAMHDHARQVGNLRDEAAVLFAFYLNSELRVHDLNRRQNNSNGCV